MFKFDWLPDTEMVGIELHLEANNNALLRPNYTTALHAWFLDCVRQDSPELSAILHDQQSEKSFTLSPLQGNLITQPEGVEIVNGGRYVWQITLFTKQLCDWAEQWHIPRSLNLRFTSFLIKSVGISLPPTTYHHLFANPLPSKPNFSLSFLSPTSFRHRKHHLPLPLPANIFHSYLRRWLDFSRQEFEPELFLDWIDHVVYVNKFDITCEKVASGKQGFVTGFVGLVEFGVDAKAKPNPELQKLLYALVQFAPYCGTGHKTTFGLGQTIISKVSAKVSANVSCTSHQELLATRIHELSSQFLELKKNQNSDRSRNTANLWAVLLARRERGESLEAIATDLEVPYQTAKSYLKLARKALGGGK